jgi:hypothetical protein
MIHAIPVPERIFRFFSKVTIKQSLWVKKFTRINHLLSGKQEAYPGIWKGCVRWFITPVSYY